ncbi:cytidine deaminase [Aquabacterium sp. A7-Y]|uniref:cytidine deaminase n=1 Tax=Aquabacterium sp. A7-Y TaxID=1349605 RepID=UPI00223DC068|nr:cytidine deaminase [Aquabacterium sp. A7-Y]MCW7542055.1 cytidine deaminase [Aquabacterium sp. A7-Y]
MSVPPSDDELIDAARRARDSAHAPYSRFRVGAALLADDGRVFAGCNVENASYGLCNCAERTAFFSAIAAGVPPGRFRRLAVIGDTQDPISPCGACRQVMLELGGPHLEVLLANLQGGRRLTRVDELLPFGFGFDAPA